MAGRLLEQALPIYRDTGQMVPLIAALPVLADLELNRGRLERASAAATEALERAKELDLSRHVAWALICSAAIEAVLGRVDACRAHVAEAVAKRAPDDELIKAHALDALGRLLASHSRVPGLPLTLDLRNARRIVVEGDREAARALARAVVAQAAAFHPPERLAVSLSGDTGAPAEIGEGGNFPVLRKPLDPMRLRVLLGSLRR